MSANLPISSHESIHMTKILKTTFPREFSDENLLKVSEHDLHC